MKPEFITIEPHIRLHIAGVLDNVNGPLCGVTTREEDLYGYMGWKPEGRGKEVVAAAFKLLQEGKAVELRSRFGRAVFSPYADGEAYTNYPASSATVYNYRGEVVQRVIRQQRPGGYHV